MRKTLVESANRYMCECECDCKDKVDPKLEKKVVGEESGESFFDAYVTAALWSSTDDEGNPLDDNYSIDDISQETLDKMKEEADKFEAENKEVYTKGGWSDAQAGHDFWLTRNGHGAGFWDRSELDEEIGKQLTDASKKFGEVDLYVGDDGKLYT